jgi:hypothetical protein
MIEFTSRINNFCSVVSKMSVQPSLAPNDPPPPPGTSYESPSLLQTKENGSADVGHSAQGLQARLLHLYSTRFYWLVPVVNRVDLQNQSPSTMSQSMLEAIMAYCLQSLYHAGLHQRLLSLRPEFGGSDADQSALDISIACFRRALAYSGHFVVYSQPSLQDIQRHIFMSLFLLNTGDFQAVYNITGLAIGLAKSLNLHRQPPSHLPAEEAELHQRIWWTLLHIDFHCSRYLGKPTAVALKDTTCARPRAITIATDSVPLETDFHNCLMSLTVTARKVAEALNAHHDIACDREFIERIEWRAELLSQEISELQRWRDSLLQTPPFANLRLCSKKHRSRTFEIERNEFYDDDSWMNGESTARILQCTLLELQYHDIVIWFHRPFIQFPTRGLVPQRSPHADIHATTALHHAFTIIEVVHSRALNHDVLYGCCEIYQYVWNAGLTLIGFMLAYPLCYWFPEARKHAETSLQILEAGGVSNTIASRATHLTQYLLGRVDVLMALLRSDQCAKDTAGNVHRYKKTIEEVDVLAKESSPAVLTPDPAFDALWSWADTVDPETWHEYCNEISDVLTDIPEII